MTDDSNSPQQKMDELQKLYDDAARPQDPPARTEDPIVVRLKDYAHRRPTDVEDATRAARFVGAPTKPSFFPEFTSTKAPPTAETVAADQVLKEAGELPAVRLAFSDSTYEVSTEALRLAQQQLRAAHDAFKDGTPVPELMITSGDVFGMAAGEWKFTSGLKSAFVQMPATMLERTVFSDSEADPKQGLIGPAHLRANFAEVLAAWKQPPSRAQSERDWTKAVDAIAAQATGEPCVLADAIQAAALNNAARFLGEVDSEDLSHMLDSTDDRIQALQAIAQAKGKPCKGNAR